MRSAAVLALLLCAGQATSLPVNSPMDKGDTEVMKCIVEVISDSLSKPSPMPVSQECWETLRGDERILSILRHQNLLKELQDLALQGAKERAQQQKKHHSFEEELSEVLESRGDDTEPQEAEEGMSSKQAVEQRGDLGEAQKSGKATGGPGPQTSPEPGQEPGQRDKQAPGQEEAANAQTPTSLPGPKHPDPQPTGDSQGPSQGPRDREDSLNSEQGQQTKRAEEEAGEEAEEEAEAGKKAVPGEPGPTVAFNPHQSSSYKEIPKGESRPEALAVDGAEEPGAEEAWAPEGKGEREHSRQEEEVAGPPQGLFRGGKSEELEQEERLSREWEEAKRWSKMDQLAKELTAEKRLEGAGEEDDPDRSMKLSFRTQAYGFRGPGLQLRRGWRPSSREDSVEAGLPARGYPEDKKEEEGSANRRAEDQELESLSAIEAELEKVAHQLRALRRG